MSHSSSDFGLRASDYLDTVLLIQDKMMNNQKVYFNRIRLYLISFLVIAASADSISQISIITERLRNDLISQNVRDSAVSNLLTTLRADGGWDDVDYSNRDRNNWQPVTHSRRLVSICQAYNKPESRYFHRPEVKAAIRNLFRYYLFIKPVSDNWWYNAIGAPTNLGPALVLMKTGDNFGFDQATLDSLADDLLFYYNESAKKWSGATTGANKIWLLKSSIDKACVKNNEEVLRENFSSAFEEARIMPEKAEGIKTDQSFWQHGPQLYNGGYGMSFMSDITYFGSLAHGTDYAMSESQVKTITDALLDGFQWFCQKQAFDFGAAGREITRRNALSSAGLRTFATRLIAMNAPRQDELKDCISFINGESQFRNPGNRHFWKSDIMVNHGKDFYLSAKIPSKRTYGTERMNDENLKRKWLPWGATNIMIDGDEYRNIFAAWDWSRIPGVTSVIEDVPRLPVTGSAYIISSNEFAGGASDGIFGIAAYDFSWDGISARKAYFFTPDAMYCMGAGIKAEKSNPVVTNVNQCFSSGDITIKNKKKKSIIETKESTSSELTWIHHDRIGYLFPSGGDITVKNMEQSGSWYDISLSASKVPVTHKVFSTWIGHGNNPTDGKYEYIIVPSVNIPQFSKWIKKNPLKMVTNTTDIQAVYHKKKGIYGIAFYRPGSVTLEKGLYVGADKPCLMLFENGVKGIYKFTISDPTQIQTDLKILISKRLSGDGITVNEDNISTIKCLLPSGDEAGKSISYEFNDR